ncbi:bifunctional diaminohydroxyphosphoribosylaminopyrimidine deaminase/5-amino-6-(5-phosphoribosylamino)uracil reductase RibD [Mesoterricola sediminis]|uniref:Riboflavin biosynthesis protein RibD n=1 Tax=Mesoterricola sediminis TaxID=2927980 RepID=A0AA48GUV0_9BACT|nr:bifunctional diaminohydroxyphosphoribosylaminopyrimidine deaminase/5-amino-6-(5-phosphoribosylamino)uracil reductase RibD [Mesoterricola sediminis]BDU76045.1 riboflavin biosynthesis protein RibD [Mesoterricola sediminis]
MYQEPVQTGAGAGWLPDPARAVAGGPEDLGTFEAATGGPWPRPSHLQGDARFMAMALREALGGVGLASPNPPVGCVLVQAGEVIGAGAHTRTGGPHAEIVALTEARRQGRDPAGATAYVTLEPCCHQGRTPPCADALVAAGIRRVVAGAIDPNPRVDGGGLRRLRAAGVEVGRRVLAEACEAFHAPFFKRVRTGLPWVTFLGHPAPSLAGPDPVFRRVQAAFRCAADAVATDLPTLRIHALRLGDPWVDPPAHRRLRRVILDPEGHLEAAHPIWEHGPCLRAVAGLRAPLPGVGDLPCGGRSGDLDLGALLGALADQGVGRILFEGGEALGRSLLRRGLLDEVVAFRSAGAPAGPQGCGLPCEGTHRHRFAVEGGAWEIYRI